jgi:hypothetical protein
VKIIEQDYIDWEPLFIAAFSRSGAQIEEVEFNQFIQRWARSKRCKNCGAPGRRQVNFFEFDAGAAAQVQIEPMCRPCLDDLASRIESEFPEIERLEIGAPMDTGASAVSRILDIPAKSVEFEDGTIVAVPAFSISQRPVLIGEVDEFLEATGYVLTTTRKGLAENYRRNFRISGVSKRLLARQSASWMSFEDAMAYCQWAKVRLPSEAEWMAASVVDERIYEIGDVWSTASTHLRKDLLEFLMIEWTGTVLHSGLVVCRCGPRVVRYKDWRGLVSTSRKMLKPDDVSHNTYFRICPLSPPPAMAD